jgi:putative flavoprotein involved in K+ transport
MSRVVDSAVHEGTTPTDRPEDDFEVVVIGAGQAGLGMGYFLARRGRHFVILDRADSIAAAWRERWESLTLFTPRRYNSLPGLPFAGDPDGYPTRDEVIAYLERYAETFELPIQLNSNVRRLSSDSGRFLLEVGGRTVTVDQVVVATGPFQTPYVPRPAARLAPDVVQFHSTGYAGRATFPRGRCSSSAAATRASRSRRSLREHTRRTSRSARARRRSRKGFSVATSSGG